MAKQLITKQALDEFGKIWVKTLKEQLINNRPYAKNATGALVNSVSYRLKQNEQSNWEITLLSEDYLKFVDKGVSGTIRKYNTPFSYKTKKPPISKIKNWVQVKGIPKEAAFPIQNKIFRFGLKPTNVINKTIREIEYKSKWIQKFEGDIANTIIENVKEQFGYSKTT